MFVEVADRNDNNPAFYPRVYYTSIPQTAGVGYSVATVIATDADAGDNGTVRYSLSQPQGGANGLFGIDSVSGLISVQSSLSNAESSYSIQVTSTSVSIV